MQGRERIMTPTKFPKAVKQLLFEAYRRNEMTLDAQNMLTPLHRRWLGLGTEAAYRPVIVAGLMKFWDDKTPRRGCMGWLVLTEKGIAAMMQYNDEFAEVVAKLRESQDILLRYQCAMGITK